MKSLKQWIKERRLRIAAVVRRAIFREPFYGSMMMHGVVLCKCGGQIISNSGKVFLNVEKNTLKCWRCGRLVNASKAYRKRKENKTVII